MTLADFQQAFWHDLWSPGAPGAGQPWAGQPGFAVYRNTVLAGCVDNLLALYPAVRRLTGDDWLGAMALDYARAHPPCDGCLQDYGADFPAHLAQEHLPWLPEVAQLECLFRASQAAADAPVLAPQALAALDAEAVAGARLQLHPATRWQACSAWPVFSLWQAAHEAWADPAPPHWQGQGALFTRPGATVLAQPLGAGGCALLDGCAQGLPMPQAVAAALAAEPSIDLGALLAQLLTQGAFTAINP